MGMKVMDPKIKKGNEKLNVSISKAAKELLKSKAENKRDYGRLVEEAILKVYGEKPSEKDSDKQLEEMFLST